MPLDPLVAAAVAPAALMIEAAVGYPAWIVRRVGHPVMLFGFLIAWLDRRLNHEEHSFAARRAWGLVALALLLLACGGGAILLASVLRGLPQGWLWEALAASTLLAQRSLYEHVQTVADALRLEGLASGRRAVSMIVGRDVSALDHAGVSRAAIESLSENFSDGVVSPSLWLLVGGLPGIVLYKAINTADSMIGHRSPRYEAFGWGAARLDDLVNLPGARLTALLIALAAWGHGGIAALQAAWADAGKHRSPNAGWPEAAMAGALGLRLGGPRRYGDLMVDGVWLGTGREAAAAADIAAALRLYGRACGWLILATAIFAMG